MKITKKILLACLLLITSKYSSKGQQTNACDDLTNTVSCDRNIVLATQTVDPDSVEIEIVITEFNDNTCSAGCEVLDVVVLLSDTNFFEPIGNSGNPMFVQGFRLSPNLITLSGYAFFIDLSLSSPSAYNDSIFPFDSYSKRCGNCSSCFSSFQLKELWKKLAQDTTANGYTCLENLNPDHSGFASLTGWTGNNVEEILNWFVNRDQPTFSDWTGILDSDTGWYDIPSVLCEEEASCPCLQNILTEYMNLEYYIREHWNTHSSIEDYVLNYFLMSCDCFAMYCPEIYFSGSSGIQSVVINLMPLYQGGLPAISIKIVKDGSYFSSTIAYSFTFTPLTGCGISGNITCIDEDVIIYASPDSFSFAAGWASLLQYYENNCDFPCKDCIGSFSPLNDSTYVVSAWVNENVSGVTTSYFHPYILVEFYPPGSPDTLFGKGPIIDGWQKIDETFVIPGGATHMYLKLGNSGPNHVYFDDIRVFPQSSNVKSFVYDIVSKKFVAELDEQNYATFYEYDNEGKLVRIKKESERGILTIKETRSNTPKR